MIARLSGILLDKSPPLMVIDVNGVGYEIEAPLGVFCVCASCDVVYLNTIIFILKTKLNTTCCSLRHSTFECSYNGVCIVSYAYAIV